MISSNLFNGGIALGKNALGGKGNSYVTQNSHSGFPFDQAPTKPPKPNNRRPLTAQALPLAYCGKKCNAAAPTAGPAKFPRPIAASCIPPCSPLAWLMSME